jgi:hypothetical protein
MFAIKLIWLECPETMGRKSFAYEQGRERPIKLLSKAVSYFLQRDTFHKRKRYL